MLNRSGSRLFCLEGIDASGKSTIAAMLRNNLSEGTNCPAVLVGKRNVDFSDTFIADQMNKLRTAIWDYPSSADISKLGDMHWLHLIAAWFGALDTACIRPLLQTNHIVIVDGWIHKYIARFLLKDRYDPALIWAAFATLSVPDKIIFLDVEPNIAVRRRKDFLPSELGRYDGIVGSQHEAFTTYQSAVMNIYREIAYRKEWLRIVVGSADSLSLAALITKRLREERLVPLN
jgi:thymidylate kinase